MMKTIILTAAAALVMAGCGNLDTGDTVYDTGADNSVAVGDGSSYVENNIYTTIDMDGNATLSYGGETVPYETETGEIDSLVVGDFPGADAPKSECNAAGFFWCSIEKACTRTPLDDSGSGSCSK